ncbi:MAG: hypothetical protein EXR93_01340 [Gemmatimonadetes bacterium]|nr:hypothetical protein [Gemmatimonadota bacterium]
MIRHAAIVLSLLGGVAPLAAQTRLVIGRVDDSLTTNALPAGRVRVLGAKIETPINYDGTFVLYVPVREVTLQIQSIGYQPREVRVPVTMQAIDVALLRDYFRMDQVVVSGQGTGVDRRNLASAVGEVHGEDFNRVPMSSVDEILRGRVTGVQTTSGSAAPGGGMKIQLRGVTSLLGSADPLFIVDGIIVSNVAIPGGTNAVTRGQAGVIASMQENPLNRIADLNLNDIERIEVLKGASAAAMYGSRASNGVILITTKRGEFQNQQ